MFDRSGLASPTLANLVLDGLERRLADRIRKRWSNGRVIYNPKINFIRYADHFVVTGASPETLAKAQEVVVEILAERGLTLSPEKTRIVPLSEGFNFLGQNVRSYGDKVLIKPSKEALAKIYDKLRGIIRRSKSTEQRDLIRMLNPVIQGWVNYHRHAVFVGRLQQTRLPGLEVALAVGTTQASRQGPAVDQGTLLACPRDTDVDLRSRRHHRRHAADPLPGVRDGYPDPSSRQGTSGGQPVLATVGRLLGGTTRPAGRQHAQRAETAPTPVVIARRLLRSMPRAHNQGNRLGRTSPAAPRRRGIGAIQQSKIAAPELSSTASCQ
jgi:hypothetical protein